MSVSSQLKQWLIWVNRFQWNACMNISMKIASCDIHTTVFQEVKPCNLADGTNISEKPTTIWLFHSSTLKIEAGDYVITLVSTYNAEGCSYETNSGILVGEIDKEIKHNALRPWVRHDLSTGVSMGCPPLCPQELFLTESTPLCTFPKYNFVWMTSHTHCHIYEDYKLDNHCCETSNLTGTNNGTWGNTIPTFIMKEV